MESDTNRLQFDPTTFEHVERLTQGKQGVVGIVRIQDTLYVYKISQYMNHLCEHEYLMMKALESLHEYCPHFCRAVALINCSLHPHFRDGDSIENPFTSHPQSIILPVLLMEYIPKSIAFLSMIDDTSIPLSRVFSVLKQTLAATTIAQRSVGFVHYDLHALNILLRVTHVNTVHMYILNHEQSIVIPTYGFSPAIIDYGFSRANNMQKQPLSCSLAFTDSGYMSPMFDAVADMRVLLVSLTDDLISKRPLGHRVQRFVSLVYNLFKELPIDWESGWDVRDEPAVIDQLFEYIENIEEESPLFHQYAHFCLDMLQSIIELPICSSTQEGSLRELEETYTIMVRAFLGIEHLIQNTFYALYTFRCITNLVRLHMASYLSESDTIRQDAVIQFSTGLEKIMYDIAKISPEKLHKTISVELLLCSIVAFVEQFEWQIQRLTNKLYTTKKREYAQMKVNNISDILCMLDIVFPDTYQFEESTEIRVFDAINKSESSFQLPTQYISILNEIEPFERSTYLRAMYDMINEDDSDDDNEDGEEGEGVREDEDEGVREGVREGEGEGVVVESIDDMSHIEEKDNLVQKAIQNAVSSVCSS